MIIIPVYDMLLLPGITFYFRKDTLERLQVKECPENEDVLFLLLKTDRERKNVEPTDFYDHGLHGKVINTDGEGSVGIRVMDRVIVSDIEVDGNANLSAIAVIAPEIDDIEEEEENQAFQRAKQGMLQFVSQYQWGVWARALILQWHSLEEIACSMAVYLEIPPEEKYEIISTDSKRERTELLMRSVFEFLEVQQVSSEAEYAQQETNERVYREDAIKKQIDFLQNQLDEMHPENVTDVRLFEKKIETAGMKEEVKKEALKVLNRMKQEGKDSHEYGMLYDYLDFITSLSFTKEAQEEIDLKEAEKVLSSRHYGLDRVKKRIIEQIAVMQLTKKQSGSILLFVGAPGTGKTSIGQSIADALHRKYVRISLGGVKDEAEIRGHRRTYIGAMPGRIMEAMKQAGTSNPVVVLDEVDKLSQDYNGDPASALLEVLDPEQNFSFTDHYMNVPYDLSDVLFVCTANTTDTIPEPLLNRMEVIEFPGYTPIEKVQIAAKHLIPQAMKDVGIKSSKMKVNEDAIWKIIDNYTMESGVRGLKKQIQTLCRKVAVLLVQGEVKSITINQKRVTELLGNKIVNHDHVTAVKKPGIVTGLAWTRVGGEILFIETAFTKGEGRVILTGQLGDVMKESMQIAITLVKERYPQFVDLLKENDLHIHVPEGAVPKDGPSAGITITTALTSLVLNQPVSPEYAMTGEVSLRGVVMPIGGLPEKLMAAERSGVKTVFIPKDNVMDLDEVAKEVKEKLTIVPVEEVEEVLNYVLTEEKKGGRKTKTSGRGKKKEK